MEVSRLFKNCFKSLTFLSTEQMNALSLNKCLNTMFFIMLCVIFHPKIQMLCIFLSLTDNIISNKY